ncbi:two-component system, OmpR family, sensor histidine kinase QseC [Pseudomonas segetis]|uniref:histidine kinase n=2 Tax=Pseudomonas segetis TaxID=298908 RepID=A0A239CTY4_9PSED|nr:two-component system, OmpR family, sensor histidine kinase QseC [Pseudomonas segetis]
MMRSIRSRTLALVLGLLSVTMTVISFKSYHDARHETEELFDAQLAQTARLLAGFVGADMPDGSRALLQNALNQALADSRSDEKMLGGHPYEGKLAFQVIDDQGKVLLHSASAPEPALQRILAKLHMQNLPAHNHTEGEPLSALERSLIGYHDIKMDQNQWRLFMLRDLQDDHWIMVGERGDVRGELVSKIAKRSLIPDLFGLPLLALLVWGAVGWGLRPLQTMANNIKRRAPDNLSPMIVGPLPSELEPMNAALNRLLMQVNQLLNQEKRFIADAAHELRTPLAVLRIHAQNALQTTDPSDRDEALRQLGVGVERATRVVAQLLTLARLDPHVVQLAMVDFDLLAYSRNELAELTPLALEKNQELTLDADENADFNLHGDSPSIGTLLQNLISNAVQYTPAGGHVQVCIESSADSLRIRVQDSGPGIDKNQRAKVFERFYRQGDGQGAGLGLSIVMRVIELHGGTIALTDSPLGGLEVSVELPRACVPGRRSTSTPNQA